MTDEHMDARLHAAGERWRAANEAPAGVDVAATVATSEPAVVAPAGPRRPRHWGLLASAAAVAAALAVGGTFALRGGNGTPNRANTENAGLVGTVWELLGYNDGPDLRESSTSTLYIGPDGQLVADDSCAVIGAKAQTGEGQLTVTDQIVRYRSCTDTVGEMVFTSGGTKVLDGTSSYSIDGEKMTISRDGTTMHFVAAPANVPAPTLDVPTFVGAHWKLVKAVDATGNDVPITGDIPFYVADDGTLTASDGCNKLTGTVHGIGRVRFEDVGGTEIGCDTEQAIRAVLDGTADESVLDATMTLHKDGAGGLTYQWVPADTTATDPQNLDGRTWRLASVAGDRAVSDAQLNVNGTTYTANDGCQEFTGHVSVQPGSIAFTGVPQGNPPCGGRGADQATTIDSFLDSGGLWAVRDNQLVLYDGGAQAFSLVFTDGSGTPPTVTNPADALIGKTWYLQEIGASLVDLPVPNVTVVFDRAGGYELGTSCGAEGGRAEFGSRTVEFSGLHTVIAHSCPYDPRSQYFESVRGVFTGRAGWSVEDDHLIIGVGDTTLTFGTTPGQATAEQLSGLTKQIWKLRYVEADLRSAGPPPRPTSADVLLTFLTHGRARVSEICERHVGPVRLTGTTVVFGGMKTLPQKCVAIGLEPSAAEQAVLVRVLHGTTTWTIDNGRLTLTKGDSALVFAVWNP